MHVAVCAAIYAVALLAFVRAGYIDWTVIRAVYLPVGVVAIVAMLFRQRMFGYIFSGAAIVGLLVEYLIHMSQEYPTMKGAFVNTVIVGVGLILGIAVQVIVTRRRRSRETATL